MKVDANIRSCELPSAASLNRYNDGHSFTDSYCTDVDGAISLAAFVEAFYTTPLFKLERIILKWAVNRPSTDEQAAALAAGALDKFAAWHVENRTETQLLMNAGRTLSWFMVEPIAQPSVGAATRLYFGSAVVAKASAPGASPELGFLFSALLGFHKLYSRALLHSARSRLAQRVI